MFVYEGINELRNSLSLASEQSLGGGFPLDGFITRIIELLKQPAIMDISNEIKCKFPLAFILRGLIKYIFP